MAAVFSLNVRDYFFDEIGSMEVIPVEISKVVTGNSNASVNASAVDEKVAAVAEPAQGAVETTDANQKAIVDKDFHLDINDVLRQKLTELAKNLQGRQELIESLPQEIKEAVTALLQETGAGRESVSKGVVEVFKQQRVTAEVLNDLADVLQVAVSILETGEAGKKLSAELAKRFSVLQQNEQPLAKDGLPRLLESQTLADFLPEAGSNGNVATAKELSGQVQNTGANVFQAKALTPGSGTNNLGTLLLPGEQGNTPKQAAIELMQLAKVVTDDNRTMLGQLQKLSEAFKAGEGLQTQQAKNFAQATSALTVLQPDELKSVAGQHDLPQLKTTWTMRAIAAAEPYMEMTADELKSAVQVLRELGKTAQEVSGKAPLSAAGEKLALLAEQLPGKVMNALAESLQSGNIQEKLAKMETNLNLALGVKQSSLVETAAGGKTVLMPDVKALLESFTGQFGKAADDVVELMKMVKQTAAKDAVAALLQGKVERLTVGLDLKNVENNSAWTALQQKAESNASGVLLPDSVRRQQNPELTKAALALRIASAAEWQEHSASTLRQAAATVKEIAASVQKPEVVMRERQAEQSVLSFSTGLQMGEGVVYPAHIHIYHQREKEQSRRAANDYETWLRISLETKYIGDVTAVFRVYEEERLDVRVGFKMSEALQQFRQQLPELRKKLENERLRLADLGGNQI